MESGKNHVEFYVIVYIQSLHNNFVQICTHWKMYFTMSLYDFCVSREFGNANHIQLRTNITVPCCLVTLARVKKRTIQSLPRAKCLLNLILKILSRLFAYPPWSPVSLSVLPVPSGGRKDALHMVSWCPFFLYFLGLEKKFFQDFEWYILVPPCLTLLHLLGPVCLDPVRLATTDTPERYHSAP